MSPEYKEGDFVLIVKSFRRNIKVGDVIVFKNKLYGILIKRVQKITDDGVYVQGTGESSLDSRRLGPINFQAVRGKVIWHLRRD
ncbi:MAG: S26 family signal peptidase [Anaerolineae bacterium]|nr:S26 family signal peptidase [Anaerolineae bacterium]